MRKWWWHHQHCISGIITHQFKLYPNQQNHLTLHLYIYSGHSKSCAEGWVLWKTRIRFHRKSHNTCTMLTRFITSQHDHSGYHGMDVNNSLGLQDCWHLPPSPLSLDRGTDPWEYGLGDNSSLPSFVSSPSPNLPLHSPPTRWTTNRNGVSSSTATALSSLSKPRSQTPSLFPSSVGSGTTCLPNSISMELAIYYNRESASGRGGTGGGQGHWRLKKKKNDKDRITLTTVTS